MGNVGTQQRLLKKKNLNLEKGCMCLKDRKEYWRMKNGISCPFFSIRIYGDKEDMGEVIYDFRFLLG